MSRIHFTALFGIDLDDDIMVQWCHHYLACAYDTYTVFLHGTRQCDHYSLYYNLFRACGFNVIEAPDAPYTTQMRHDLLTRFAASLDPLDYMVVADSDEFHTTGPWASNFRDLIMSCDVLCGTLVDRYADRLKPVAANMPLDEQYPYSGDVFKILFDKSDDPEKGRWRVPNPNKILAARAGLPVAHQGSHALYRQDAGVKIRRGCIVNHFKWRQSIFDRLMTKWYHHDGFDQAVREFFQPEIVEQLKG